MGGQNALLAALHKVFLWVSIISIQYSAVGSQPDPKEKEERQSREVEPLFIVYPYLYHSRTES